MRTVLAVETSTSHGSVAVLVDGVATFEECFVAERGHSSLLFPLLQRALASTPSLDLLAVGLGPGSYAGIRIGIAAISGIAWSRNVALVGVPSVAAMSQTAPYVSVGDARRGMFYFASVENGICKQGPDLFTADELKAQLEKFSGTSVFASAPLPEFGAVLNFPVARRVAEVALTMAVPAASAFIEPLYLREAHITMPRVR